MALSSVPFEALELGAVLESRFCGWTSQTDFMRSLGQARLSTAPSLLWVVSLAC